MLRPLVASLLACSLYALPALADPSPAFLVANINTANDVMLVGSFADVNGVIFFVGSRPGTGAELWKTDGTSAAPCS